MSLSRSICLVRTWILPRWPKVNLLMDLYNHGEQKNAGAANAAQNSPCGGTIETRRLWFDCRRTSTFPTACLLLMRVNKMFCVTDSSIFAICIKQLYRSYLLANSHRLYFLGPLGNVNKRLSSVLNQVSPPCWGLFWAMRGRAVATQAKCVTSWLCPISFSINATILRKC